MSGTGRRAARPASDGAGSGSAGARDEGAGGGFTVSARPALAWSWKRRRAWAVRS